MNDGLCSLFYLIIGCYKPLAIILIIYKLQMVRQESTKARPTKRPPPRLPIRRSLRLINIRSSSQSFVEEEPEIMVQQSRIESLQEIHLESNREETDTPTSYALQQAQGNWRMSDLALRGDETTITSIMVSQQSEREFIQLQPTEVLMPKPSQEEPFQRYPPMPLDEWESLRSLSYCWEEDSQERIWNGGNVELLDIVTPQQSSEYSPYFELARNNRDVADFISKHVFKCQKEEMESQMVEESIEQEEEEEEEEEYRGQDYVEEEYLQEEYVEEEYVEKKEEFEEVGYEQYSDDLAEFYSLQSKGHFK